MSAPVIQFDYDFSPYGQKTRLILHTAGVAFQRCDQPLVLPRKDLEALGITYRRIPLLAVGKDVYCDSARITDVILTDLGKVPASAADAAWQTWGDVVFLECLGLIPQQALTPDFVKDREPIFPMLKRSDLKTLRPSAAASFHQRLKQVETVFLANSSGPFINGENLSLADIHVIWPIRWAMNDLGIGKEAEFRKEAYPKLWRMIEGLPEVSPPDVGAEEARKTILEGKYTAKGTLSVDEKDPLGIKAGTPVTVESFDATPGAYPQAGKLIGTTPDEVTLELENGIHLHFPRIGYIVRADQAKANI